MRVQIFYDWDADGITSAVIAGIVHDSEGDEVILTPIIGSNVRDIKKKTVPADKYYFLDMGSTIMCFIEKEFGKKAIVIDHHQGEREDFFVEEYINPMVESGKGISYATASTLTYMYFKERNGVDNSLAFPAIVGAIGDFANSDGKFYGVNKKVLDDLRKADNVRIENDYRGMGKGFMPLALTIDTNLFPPVKLSFKEIIEALGSNSTARYYDVKNDVKSIMEKMYGHDKSKIFSTVVFGNFAGETMEAHDIALILNNFSGDIMNVIQGFTGERVNIEMNKFETIKKFMDFEMFIQHNEVRQLGRLLYIKIPAELSVNIGFVANYLLIKMNAGVSVVLRNVGTETIVSVHSYDYAVDGPTGVAAALVGGRGGGHPIAAGAIIPSKNEKYFLKKLEKEIFK